jgi:hypothetical protein
MKRSLAERMMSATSKVGGFIFFLQARTLGLERCS